MRHLHYFLIFIAIVSALAGGSIAFSQKFFYFYEKADSANLQANLLAIALTEAEREAEFLREKPTTLLFVGDIMLSRGVAEQIEKNQDFNWPFLKIASATQAADLTFGNLEGPISFQGKNRGSIYSFKAGPAVVEGLKFAGFDILSLANNHIFDWGKNSLENTIAWLKDAGLASIGAGKNYEEANSPLIKEINGAKIAFFAYTNLLPQTLNATGNSAGISNFDIEKIKNEIRKIKESRVADIVIISLHWGEEYRTHSNSKQENIAHELIDAGADLIVGHHPHVVEEIKQYGRGWIAYSLGNFVFDQNFSKETMEGLIVKAIIKNKKVQSIEPIKIRISDTFQPEINSL